MAKACAKYFQDSTRYKKWRNDFTGYTYWSELGWS